MISKEMELMMSGHGLTTAQIYYAMPDYQTILQTYLWQDYDLAPEFPKLRGFLEFWQEELDGPIRSVRYTHKRLISPSEWRNVGGEFTLQ